MIERRADPRGRERFAATCDEIRALIERPCADMEAPQLDRLVTEMARIELRYKLSTAKASLADEYFIPHRRA
jgi:hypothetical protein